MRLGYACINQELRKKHIFTGRTCRLSTVKERGFEYVIELLRKNLEDLMTILQWNEAHGIRFFRIDSGIAPHITNPALIESKKTYVLAYSLEPVQNLLKSIGLYAKSKNHRLTFHPDLYLNLGSPSTIVSIKSAREMWYHAQLMDMMHLDLDSVMVLHGGGAYGNKTAAIRRWIARFLRLPNNIKRRVVIENDEFVYSIDDVLLIGKTVGIPVVLDVFHWSIYERYHPGAQTSIENVLPQIIKSWKSRTPKFHISEQHSHAPVASHSDYIKVIPSYLLTAPTKFARRIDLMIEAKTTEKALRRLRKKYLLI